MNEQRKKQLLAEYKYRKSELGIICLYDTINKASFLATSKDTKADLNSHRFKLKANWHGNPEIQALWNQQGEKYFELKVIEVLETEEDELEAADLLDELLSDCLQKIENSKRI